MGIQRYHFDLLSWPLLGVLIPPLFEFCAYLQNCIHSWNRQLEWSNKLLLKLNIVKCKTVSFGRNINKNYTYSLHGTQLERLDHMKDL